MLINNSDEEKLKTLQEEFNTIEQNRKDLKEEKVYKEQSKSICYKIQVLRLKLLNNIYLS